MATTPFDIFPHLPNPPDPMRGSFEELRAWAPAHTRAVADLFRRYQRAVTNVSAVVSAAAHSGGYGTSATPGAGSNFIRSDARLVYPEAIATVANRTKTLLVTDDPTYSALLTASAAFGVGSAFVSTASQKGLSLMAPGGTIPFVLGPNGTIGRGIYSDTDLMRHDSVTIASGVRVRGWNLAGMIAGTVAAAPSTGGITGIEGAVTDSPTSVSTQAILGIDFSARAGTANAQGVIQIIRATQNSYSGASASRGAVSLFAARSLTSYAAQTVSSLAFYDITQVPLAGGTISGSVVGFKQATAFGLGATRRGVQVVNSVEVTTNDVILSGAGKRFIAKDAVDGNFYALSFQNGILMISNLGATAPTT